YVQSTNVITVTISNHGLVVGNAAYLAFPTSGASSGLYLITSVNGSVFTVATPDNAVRSGSCLLPRVSASGFVQTGTNVTVSCAAPHGLTTNQTLYIPTTANFLIAGQYQVAGIPDATHFVYYQTNSVNQTQSGFNFYPLGPPPLTRSGTARVHWNTWNLGYTDSGSTYNLGQSPLNANTVFNFYFPDYSFPGTLAAAGLTTPEFQLTSDTSVALQMNYIEGGILTNSSSINANTNGLSSFNNGSGAIVLDLGGWYSTNNITPAGIPNLISNLNTLLLAGQLSAAARTNIYNFVTNTAYLPLSAPPTPFQVRDHVRAVVHLITASPDYLIQK
ncbi:MAG TPA: DUF1800 family protein, partial [Verrucomicrobiae bacterium]